MKKQTITLSLLCAVALSAATPNTGDILRQVEPIKMPVLQKALPSVGAGEYKAPLSVQDDVKTFVKSFKFSGNTVFGSEALSVLVKSYENKEVGINALKEIASVITKYYRDNGYFVARAYIPAQSMENGIIEIAIIEGSYGAVELKNSSYVDTHEVQNFMDELKHGQIVSAMSLERKMLLINDLSGAQVTNAEVYPGQAVGTSDFRVTVSPTPKYSGYAMVDNYGSRYTGMNRLNVMGAINSVSGIGDTLSLSGLISNTRDLKNIRLAYDRPLGYTGLKGGVSASVTDYTLSEITNYEAFGRTNVYNAYVSYPYLKTRSQTISTDLSYDYKSMKDSSGIPGLVEESRKKLNALTLRLNDKQNTALLNLPGTLNASAGVTIGHLGLGNQVAYTNDVSLNSQGNYSKLNLSLNHTQAVAQSLNFQTTIKAQKSFGKNLDSAEEFAVGGSNGVRAYEDSELNGDQGYSLSMDMVYSLPRYENISHNTSLFFDHAKVWKNSTTFNTEDNQRVINAIGIGYTANYRGFDLKATFAHGFGSESTPTIEADISTSTNKLLVQGMYRF